jgi:hypothetical protein
MHILHFETVLHLGKWHLGWDKDYKGDQAFGPLGRTWISVYLWPSLGLMHESDTLAL